MRIVQLLLVLGSLLPSAASSGSEQLDGVWQSQGYGYVFSIKGAVLTAYEITSRTCVEGFKAQRQTVPAEEWDAVFKSKNEGKLFLRKGGTPGHKLLHLEDSVPDIRIARIPTIPIVCEHPTENTAVGNFEVFTRTFAENYISFDLRHLAWNERVADYRKKKSTAQTTPAQLFEICKAMIAPLGDIHTYIAARRLKLSTKEFWRPGTNRIINGTADDFDKRGRWKLFAITNEDYLEHPPQMFCRRHLQYGLIDKGTGYLRILSFGGYARHNDMRALDSALDTIFSDRHLSALVVDMRLSFGGSDELGLAIASRLASTQYVAYVVQARSNSGQRDPWTPGEPILIQPSARPSFRGPVVELLGPITMSAAETFSQALMGRTPHVTRIGENTQGVFCDILDRHLPNGWTFGLPNAVYRTAKGEAFDATGIPPDIEIPVFTDADVAARKDPAMAKAVQVLLGKRAEAGTP